MDITFNSSTPNRSRRCGGSDDGNRAMARIVMMMRRRRRGDLLCCGGVVVLVETVGDGCGGRFVDDTVDRHWYVVAEYFGRVLLLVETVGDGCSGGSLTIRVARRSMSPVPGVLGGASSK